MGTFGSYHDGFDLFNKEPSKAQNILVVPGATHYDLHNGPDCVEQAVATLRTFYGENL